jgi:hypothetical protein
VTVTSEGRTVMTGSGPAGTTYAVALRTSGTRSSPR